jgi:hypothetical protein
MKFYAQQAGSMAFKLNLYDDTVIFRRADQAEAQRLLSLRSFVTHFFEISR